MKGFDDPYLGVGLMRRYCGDGSPGALVLKPCLLGLGNESVCMQSARMSPSGLAGRRNDGKCGGVYRK